MGFDSYDKRQKLLIDREKLINSFLEIVTKNKWIIDRETVEAMVDASMIFWEMKSYLNNYDKAHGEEIDKWGQDSQTT